MDNREEPNFNLNFDHFKTLSVADKGKILEKKKTKLTNNATRLWINCLTEYLVKKGYPELEAIETPQLPPILTNFYSELKKKNADQSDENDVEDSYEYKNSTLRAIRASLVRYFKDTRRVDIICNEMFIEANDMFLALTNVNKEKGFNTS